MNPGLGCAGAPSVLSATLRTIRGPMQAADLARQLIGPGGHTPEAMNELTGLRTGEQVFEKLPASAETSLAAAFERLRGARLRPHNGGVTVPAGLGPAAAHAADEEDAARVHPRKRVPEFQPRPAA